MKKISALLLTLLMNTTATEIKKFKPIDQDKMQTLLRPATPEPGTSLRMGQQIELDEAMVKNVNQIFELCTRSRSKQFDNQLVKGYNIKAISKVGLGTAAALGLGKLALGENTRGMGTELVLGTILGGGLVAGGVYWWIGREMGVITGFKGSLSETLEDLETMKTILNGSKANHKGDLE